MNEPKLLRIPRNFHTVEEVLGVARQLNLPNVLVLSELANGDLIFLDSALSCASANWLIDRIKMLLVCPDRHDLVNQNGRV